MYPTIQCVPGDLIYVLHIIFHLYTLKTFWFIIGSSLSLNNWKRKVSWAMKEQNIVFLVVWYKLLCYIMVDIEVLLPVVLSAVFSWCGGSVDTDASWGLKSVGVFCSPLTVQTLLDMILISGQSKKSKAYCTNVYRRFSGSDLQEPSKSVQKKNKSIILILMFLIKFLGRFMPK